jgi:hypothetical protein
MAKKRFKNVAKPSRFATEAERYVEAARLVSVRNLTVLEAVREAGICIPDHVEVCKQVSWPESEKWSPQWRRENRVNKLLLMAEAAKDNHQG